MCHMLAPDGSRVCVSQFHRLAPDGSGGCVRSVTLENVRTCMVLLVKLEEMAKDNSPLCGPTPAVYFWYPEEMLE